MRTELSSFLLTTRLLSHILHCVTQASANNAVSTTHLWRIVLVILATAFLSEIAGFLTHQLNLALGTLLLLWVSITYVPMQKINIRSYQFWLGLATSVAAIVSLRIQPTLRPMVVCAHLLGLYVLLSSGYRVAPELKSMAIGVFSFGLVLVFEKHSPFVWSTIQSVSYGFSRFVAGTAGRQLSMSASFSGIYVTILFVSVSVSVFFSMIVKRPINLLLIIFGFLIANGVGIAVSHPLAHALKVLLPLSKEGVSVYDRMLLSTPLLALSLGVIPLCIFNRANRPEREPVSRRSRLAFGEVGLLFLVGSVFFLIFQVPRTPAGSPTIAFYSEGYFNWLRPRHGEYGSQSGGMFGNLPVLVEALGFESVVIDSIDESTLNGVRVLFMANTDQRLPNDSYEEIRRFVQRGGSLLMLGDHTFFKDEKKNWLNAVLKPFRIRFNFDSAEYFIGGWLHSYFYPASPLTVGLGDEQNDVGSVVGASLEVSYPAVPVLIGRYGFSDEGNPRDEEGGYLGNLEYDPGEKLGDVVLAAAQNYGKGKILIFGDTSGFVNPLMVDTYPFVNRVFSWLASDSQNPAHGFRLIVSLILLALFVLFTSLSGSPSSRSLAMPIAVLLVVLLSQALIAGKVERPIRGNYALVDDSHYGRYPVEFWKPNGIMGLHLNLMRSGYLSFTMRRFDLSLLNNSKFLVLIAPSVPFSSREVRALDRYVKDGGSLMLTVGYEEKGASLSVLKHFGFDIDNIPLGVFYTNVPGTDLIAFFQEAWPISYIGEDVEVLAGRGEYPTIVTRKYGRGSIVIFGDSSFFHNINLETEDDPLIANIQLLEWLLGVLEAT